MNNNKFFKCIYCTKQYISKPSLYEHMDLVHHEQLNGLTPAHAYFNFKNHKTEGHCIICHKPTQFNEVTEKYDRLCSDICKEKYREMFKKRMMQKYGKTTLLDDPEIQKKMLSSRKISGTYIWSDGKKYTYTGTYEKDMLEFLDKVLKMKSTDVLCPAPQVFKYKFNNKEHFYIPDMYLICYNIIIEIKGTNNHYQKRDLEIQKAKMNSVLKEKKFNYLIISDKKYNEFLKVIETLKTKD